MNDFENYKKKEMVLPIVALRGLTVLPGARVQFDVVRKQSLRAVDTALKGNQKIALITQKDIRVETPEEKDLYRVGCVARVSSMLKMQGGGAKVVVEGIDRAVLKAIIGAESHLVGIVESVTCPDIASDTAQAEARIRQLTDLMQGYADIFPKIPDDIIFNVMESKSLGTLSDYMAANLPLKYELKQEVLEKFDVFERADTMISIMSKELEILELEQGLADKVRAALDKNQRDFYLREQMRVISDELGEGESPQDEANGYREKIAKLNTTDEIKEKLSNEAQRLSKMPFGSHEGSVISGYLDTVLELPFGEYTEEKLDVNSAAKQLDKDHYGLKKVKERILEYIAVRQLSPELKGQIICLVGPPGVGKTSIAASIAKTLGRSYARISLGGIRDEAEIRGHRKTYIGAMPGRIIRAIKQAKSLNPLILLDEIDKLGFDYKGDPSAALLEVLDPEQNKTFTDNYLEIPFDLSDVLFITTANSADLIPGPLYDRMEVIEIGSYTLNEKKKIAKKHLIPKQLARHGLSKSTFSIGEKQITELIDGYTREAGVRELERELALVMRKAAAEIASGKAEKIKLDDAKLLEYAGTRKHKKDNMKREAETGVATGLAYTAVGGEVLMIEVNVMEGSGKIELTGSLGDVMKESCHAAVSFIRANSAVLKLKNADFYKTKDIHIHFPEGAVPKDGPSAGITVTTALVSELTGIPVRSDIAMTGEMTLRGRVLAIGGLKEKTMAAYKNGIMNVLVPEENRSDIENIDTEVKEHLNFTYVERINEVLKAALVDSPFKEEEIPSYRVSGKTAIAEA
ncbi:MAG: endopeptidase La [Clostridia bacterium]|nr:endopeptidase La [Clostridia bacterium]